MPSAEKRKKVFDEQKAKEYLEELRKRNPNLDKQIEFGKLLMIPDYLMTDKEKNRMKELDAELCRDASQKHL